MLNQDNVFNVLCTATTVTGTQQSISTRSTSVLGGIPDFEKLAQHQR